jgi:hypothetical protein
VVVAMQKMTRTRERKLFRITDWSCGSASRDVDRSSVRRLVEEEAEEVLRVFP